MARKHSKSMKRRTHKGRRHRGGGWGFTGSSSIPGTPGIVNNPQVFTGIGDCRAVRPAYDIPYSSYSTSMKGLPGMSGGKRTRKQRRNRTQKQRGGQRGGRYGFFPEGDPNPSGQLYYAGSYAPIQRIGCEGGSFNPLNPTHTGSSAPPGAANPNYWLKGGAQQVAPATYGVGNVDSMYYYAPTGGYANTASTWKDSVGAPVQIQVPYAARAMNQACLSTGGHPPLTGALQKGGGPFNFLTGATETVTSALGTATGTATGALGAATGTATGALKQGKNALLGLFGQSTTAVPAVPEMGSETVTETLPSETVTETVTETAVPSEPTTEGPPPPVVAGGRRHKKSKSRKARKGRKGRKH
jgi:hypothetical protein